MEGLGEFAHVHLQVRRLERHTYARQTNAAHIRTSDEARHAYTRHRITARIRTSEKRGTHTHVRGKRGTHTHAKKTSAHTIVRTISTVRRTSNFRFPISFVV